MLGTIVEDRYLVEAELGSGAMGHVYRARHIKVGRQVAIKVMHAELAKVPTIVERFAREARIAARLDHPNLVSVLDVGVTPDAARLPLIVLELAPGTSMADLALAALPREHVVGLIRQLLAGLDHAHDAGLVHRDLKPDNILVEQLPDGTLVPRIVDFGIAVCNRDDDPIANKRLTEANTVIGTPFYMSPEQAMAKPLDARTDLFSLGVIMFELLAGMAPFDGTGLEVAYMNASKDAPTVAERAGILVDPLLEAFMHKLMARRLPERFQSAHEALCMLELIESDRIAAARGLTSGVAPSGGVEPIQVPAQGSGPLALPASSDAMTTLPAIVAPLAVVAPPVRRSTKVTKVEHVAGVRPARRRMVWAGALAAAALTAVVGWSAGVRPQVEPPRIESSIAVAAPAAQIRVEGAAAELSPPSAPVTAQPIAAVPAHAVKARTVVATAPTHVPSHVASRPAAVAVVQAPAASPSEPICEPVVAAPVPAATAPRSENLADRYIEVGRKLRGAPDPLWARYRLIRINEALATETSRKATLQALAEIERGIVRAATGTVHTK